MATHYRTVGFVFKKQDRNEADRVFSVYTEEFGRIEVSAKAIRKIASKLRPDIDLFYFSEIEFIQGKNNKTLVDAVKIKNCMDSYDKLKKSEVLEKISHILDSFIKGEEKDKKSFEFLKNILESIGQDKLASPNLAFQYFFWNFLSVQGYPFKAENCAYCSGKLNPDNLYFSNTKGGIICTNCFKQLKQGKKINADIVKFLRLVLNKNWQIVSKLKMAEPSEKMLLSVFEDALLSFSPINC